MTQPAAAESTFVTPGSRVIRFGVFEADLRARELRRRGAKVRLTDQPFQLLALLLERPGDVVTREELRQRLWPADTFVEFDLSLNSAVRKLRDALGDSADHPSFVETLPRRGYRFIAPVERSTAPDTIPPAADPSGAVASRVKAWRWWIAAALVMTTAAALIALSARGRWTTSGTVPAVRIRTIAVIPLINGTGDPGREYIVDGMTDDLITELTQLGIIQVISQNSSMQFKGSTKRPPEIARELKNVEGLVEGRLTLSDGTLHLTAQLIDASTEFNLWGKGYDTTNLAGLPATIAADIAAAIDGKAAPAPMSSQMRVISPEAFDLYLRGLVARRGAGTNTRTDISYFEQAIERQPDFAMAYASLAFAEVRFLFGGPMPPDEVLPRVKSAAEKALALDPTLKEAHQAHMQMRRVYGDHASADAELDQLLMRQPSAELFAQKSASLIRRGRYQDAVDAADRARLLDPLSFNAVVWYARALRAAGDYAGAVKQLQSVQHDRFPFPQDVLVSFQLGATYALSGDTKAAIPELKQAVDLSPEKNPRFRAYLGWAYAMDGRTREARKNLQDLLALRERQYVSSFGIAMLYDALGEKAPALAALERASREHASEFIQLDTYPPFKTLAAAPRYRELMHLPQK
jgi:DNA-binding winged helix-turn-helix (wHTH) protein/TolB-like protein/tetratricopeptide (TPR) repeat protein